MTDEIKEVESIPTSIPVVTTPIPGVNVTVPAHQVIEECTTKLLNILQGLPGLLSTQTAFQKLVELKVWIKTAITETAEQHQLQQQIAAQADLGERKVLAAKADYENKG